MRSNDCLIIFQQYMITNVATTGGYKGVPTRNEEESGQNKSMRAGLQKRRI